MCVTREWFGLSEETTSFEMNRKVLWSSITKPTMEKRSYDYSTAALRT